MTFRRRLNVLALRSHSHEVTGRVQAIFNSTEMLGYKSLSQSISAALAHVGGWLVRFCFGYRYFILHHAPSIF